MVGVQGKTTPGQSPESVAEAEEELRVGERLGITVPLTPLLPRNHKATSMLLAPGRLLSGARNRASPRDAT